MPERHLPREIALSAAWHEGRLASDLKTVEGVAVQIIHRGVWSHGLGPDFRDALILVDGRELRAGSIEIHLRSRGWIEHGHHIDPAYDDVILHVVGRHDHTTTQRSDGAIVPIVELDSVDDIALPDFAFWDWHRVGDTVCAARLASANPRLLRETLYRLGDTRLAARAARIEARLQSEPAAEILWGELLDGLGFRANREPMRLLASSVAVESLESLVQAVRSDERLAVARGILLGTAGFLPLSQSESHLGCLSHDEVSQLESCWDQRGAPWVNETIVPTLWDRARVRPANHPVPRLLAAASLLASSSHRGGLLSTIVDLMMGATDPVAALRDLTGAANSPRIGADRALDILASGVIPLSLAFAAQMENLPLAEAAARHWEQLPSPAANAVTRRATRQVAGPTPLGRIGARGSQGLIHLDTVLCQPRRCFECPIAAAELAVKG